MGLRGEAFSPENAVNINQRASQQALTNTAQLTPAQRAAIANPFPQANMPTDAMGNATFILPYPGAPHDGSPQDLANSQAMAQQQGQASAIQYAYDQKPGFIDKLIPALAIGMATAGVGSGVGGAVGDALGSSVAGGVAGGATAGGLSAAVQGQNPWKSTLLGGLGGGLGAFAQPASGALSSATGLPSSIASGVVRGGIGAGVGALGGAISGTGAGRGAMIGGLGGATSGLVGNLSGNQQIGNVAGTIGGALADKYLGSQPQVSGPASTPSASLPALPPAMSQAGNIGAYSGYNTPQNTAGLGYQPRAENSMAGTDWEHYGQGPEQQFFHNT